MYSLDLKERLLKSYLEGKYSQKEIVKIFGVSRSFLTDILKRYKEKGNLEPETYKCGRQGKLSEEDKAYLKKSVEKDKSITLSELSKNLEEERKVKVSKTSIHKYLKSIKMNYKKNALRSKKRQ